MGEKMVRYENFLSDIAQKTQELISLNKPHFQEKTDDFISRYSYWKEQLLAGQREALKNKKKLYVGKMPKFKENSDDTDDFSRSMSLSMAERDWMESIEKKGPRGYILYNPYEIGFFNYSDFMVKGIEGYYWGKPLPSNPVDTLRIRQDATITNPPYWNSHLKEHIQRKPVDENEDLVRKYFLLAVIHANVGYFGIPIIDPQNEAAQLVWTMYRNTNGRKEEAWGNKIQNLITAAMKDVKVDLKQCQKQITSTMGNGMSFERLDKYKTPEEYFRALEEFKRNPSNFKGGIPLTNPLLCYMHVVGGECYTVLNLLTTTLDLIKKKKAGNQSIVIDDTMISQILQQVEQQISHLAKHIKQGYWGYDWHPLVEMRGALSSIGRLVRLKTLRVPLDYVPEEFDLIEKDLIALTNIHNQHIELRKEFNERLKKMPFEQAVEILNHNPLAGEGGAEKKTGFKFSKGQIHYNGKEIAVSMGRQYEILKKLAEKIGEVISYSELDAQSVTSASEQLRTDISEIKKSLKKAKIPLTINSKRTEGYILTSK